MGRDRKENILQGETAEERDRQLYKEKLVYLEEYKRTRAGLPREEIVTDAEFIPPRTGVGVSETYASSNKPDQIKIFAPDSAMHIAMVRQTIIAAIGLDEPKEVIGDIKKKAA